MTTFIYFLAIGLFMFICVLLCAVILMQESKSMGGLGASFGGDAGDSLFGTSTADVLKKFTGWLAVVFLASCVVLSIWTSSMGRTENPDPLPMMEQQLPEEF